MTQTHRRAEAGDDLRWSETDNLIIYVCLFCQLSAPIAFVAYFVWYKLGDGCEREKSREKWLRVTIGRGALAYQVRLLFVRYACRQLNLVSRQLLCQHRRPAWLPNGQSLLSSRPTFLGIPLARLIYSKLLCCFLSWPCPDDDVQMTKANRKKPSAIERLIAFAICFNRSN